MSLFPFYFKCGPIIWRPEAFCTFVLNSHFWNCRNRTIGKYNYLLHLFKIFLFQFYIKLHTNIKFCIKHLVFINYFVELIIYLDCNLKFVLKFNKCLLWRWRSACYQRATQIIYT